jgi:hypothetical protein
MKLSELIKISNPEEVARRFKKYRGQDKATIEPSPREDKKYMVRVAGMAGVAGATRGRAIHFGSTLEDYTKHGDEKRRQAYLKRSAGIKGDWRDDKWSANNLARELLW